MEKTKTPEEIEIKEKSLGIAKIREESFSSYEPCPECGSRKTTRVRSFYISADEEQVNIMKCTECGHTYRLGSGVSGY